MTEVTYRIYPKCNIKVNNNYVRIFLTVDKSGVILHQWEGIDNRLQLWTLKDPTPTGYKLLNPFTNNVIYVPDKKEVWVALSENPKDDESYWHSNRVVPELNSLISMCSKLFSGSKALLESKTSIQ